tara:strand:- start:137 stop:973 length:837 start_codon:yes stop_codon:yes gene_type:complete
MPADIMTLVLAAALLHALWNAVVKGAGDRVITFGLVILGQTLPALLIAPFVPLPSASALPYLLLSVIIHWGYYYFLISAYRFGDLSLIYPIARGLTPILVALGALFILGEILTFLSWLGLVLISLGILILAWTATFEKKSFLGILLALGTSLMIAGYSVVDGMGVRLTEHALSYIAWLFIIEAIAIVAIFVPRRIRLRMLTRRQIWTGITGGIMASLAYGLVLIAKTHAPIAMVSALRETSVVFASLIGLMVFGEGPATWRLIAALIVVIGVIAMSLA